MTSSGRFGARPIRSIGYPQTIDHPSNEDDSPGRVIRADVAGRRPKPPKPKKKVNSLLGIVDPLRSNPQQVAANLSSFWVEMEITSQHLGAPVFWQLPTKIVQSLLPRCQPARFCHGFRTGKSRSKRRPLVFCVGMYTFCNSAWTAHIVTDTVMWCFPSPAERHGQTGQSQKAKTHHFWDADETSLR